jgi:NAD(P)-dependent dehydrogenase (short-subunit alcohol dehydrogenase family)
MKMGNVVQLEDLKSILDMFSLKGKKAVVTGAAGGIGRTSAAALAELGADVALVDLKADIAKKNADYIAKKFSVKTLALETDVSDEKSVREMVDTVTSEFGTIDILHSNAGIIMSQDTADITYADWQKMIAINLSGIFLVDTIVAKVMKINGGGSIINTASMSAHIINKGNEFQRSPVAYPTTKAGVKHLTKGLAADYCKEGIRVNSISPGVMFSGIHDGIPDEILEAGAREMVPLGRFGNMNEIGGIVAFLASDLSSYITGIDILIDGGTTIW